LFPPLKRLELRHLAKPSSALPFAANCVLREQV
jgi:hypothetical protein